MYLIVTQLKMYFTFSKPLELGPQDQLQFTVKSRTLFLFDTYIVAKQVLSLQVGVNLGVMPKKSSKAQELESHDQMHFSIKPRTLSLFVRSTVPLQVLLILVRVDLGVVKKWLSTFLKALDKEPHNQIQFCVKPSIVLVFDLNLGPYRVLSLHGRVDQGVRPTKRDWTKSKKFSN